MKTLFEDLKSHYPKAHALLSFTPSERLSTVSELNLPEDYHALYGLVSRENEESSGVFGLNRLLPVDVSSLVEVPEMLESYRLGMKADVFMPIFQSSGRPQLGYAKFADTWRFCEFDSGVEPLDETTLTEFLDAFHQKVKTRGYVEDDGLGLIDEGKM